MLQEMLKLLKSSFPWRKTKFNQINHCLLPNQHLQSILGYDNRLTSMSITACWTEKKIVLFKVIPCCFITRMHKVHPKIFLKNPDYSIDIWKYSGIIQFTDLKFANYTTPVIPAIKFNFVDKYRCTIYSFICLTDFHQSNL